MSWVGRALEWDSEFFGCAVGRVDWDGASVSCVEEILEFQALERLDVLYVLVACEGTKLVRALVARGFDRVDERLTYGLDWSSWRERPGRANREDVFVTASATDISALQDIAAEAHRDSRFYADPGFDEQACSRLYRVWIEVSCGRRADVVWTCHDAQGACGYVTCTVKDDVGSIGLVGVAPRARGRGLATGLLHQALWWFREQGVGRVDVVTQARNIPAQRLYQSAGFKLRERAVWYHRWVSQA
ncbi:MAG: GNAT family N-acetyltransferase [Myxococcota bacterium]